MIFKQGGFEYFMLLGEFYFTHFVSQTKVSWKTQFRFSTWFHQFSTTRASNILLTADFLTQKSWFNISGAWSYLYSTPTKRGNEWKHSDRITIFRFSQNMCVYCLIETWASEKSGESFEEERQSECFSLSHRHRYIESWVKWRKKNRFMLEKTISSP